MDAKALKTFLEIANTRSFSKAAENLYITPAAASARIKLLEAQLGEPVFNKALGRLQLTLMGQRLLPHAEAILLAFDKAQNELNLVDTQRQQLTLGSTPDLWHYVLNYRLSAIDTEATFLRAEAHSAGDLVGRLEEKLLDAIVTYAPSADDRFVSHKLSTLQLGLYASVENCVLAETAEKAYIQVDWGTAFLEFQSRKLGRFKPRHICNLAATAEKLVQLEAGCAYLPVRSFEAMYLIADAPLFSRHLYLVHSRELTGRKDIDKLISQLAELG